MGWVQLRHARNRKRTAADFMRYRIGPNVAFFGVVV
jgi:hypothetical protein